MSFSFYCQCGFRFFNILMGEIITHLTRGKGDLARTTHQLNGVQSVYDDIATLSFYCRKKLECSHVEGKLDATKHNYILFVTCCIHGSKYA